MNTNVLSNHIRFRRGATNFEQVAFFNGEEVGRVHKTTLNGKLAWEIEGEIDYTREGAVEKFYFGSYHNHEEPPTPPQPTYGSYNPSEYFFPNGDEVVGFWYIEEGIKWHLAVDKDGREYETVDEPQRKVA